MQVFDFSGPDGRTRNSGMPVRNSIAQSVFFLVCSTQSPSSLVIRYERKDVADAAEICAGGNIHTSDYAFS
jgi:hypothetical protein